jgi:uncharacterized OsmC-like protein
MTAATLAQAIARVKTTLTRRPQTGMHADSPAIARWVQDCRVVCEDEKGTQIATDMPVQLGGTGDRVTPGWLMRAGLASCLATRIALGAAAEGIEITRLEVSARSTSDARGLFAIKGAAGEEISPGPCEVRLEVRINARDVPRERLQALIEESYRCSPVSAALENVVPIALRIEIEPD